MQVKRTLLAIVEVFKLVHMDEAVQGAGHEEVQILVVLDFRDPAPMRMHFQTGEALFSASVLSGSLVLHSLTLFQQFLLVSEHFIAIFLLFILTTSLSFLALGRLGTGGTLCGS